VTIALWAKHKKTKQNKKFELMLIGRAKAVPVRKLSVYLQPFRQDFYGGTGL